MPVGLVATIVLGILQDYGTQALRDLLERLSGDAVNKLTALFEAGQPLTKEEVETIIEEYPLKKFEYDDVPEDE